MRVVDGDEERLLDRCALEQLLQVAQHPEPLFWRGVKGRKPPGIEERLRPVEQRREEGSELDDGLARISRAAADSDAKAARNLSDLGKQAALAHTGGAFDDDARLLAVGEPFKLASNQREFRAAPLELPQ
jgi:hypothetical protein